ncbi:hypothetical protein ACFL1E_00665 [Candidatus Omnitrophota bacterium]
MNTKKIAVCLLATHLLMAFCFSRIQAADMDFSSPEATFRTYLQACKEGSFEKSDLCSTKEFQRYQKSNKQYLSHRHPGQLRNAYNIWANKSYKVEKYGNKAIMRFGKMFKSPAPIYFVKEHGKWKMDGMFEFRNIIYSSGDNWHWKNPNIDNEKKWLNK